MTVADLNQMEAIVEVDENDVVLVSVGDTATIEIDAFRDKKFNGVVTQIGNSAIMSATGTQNEVVNFEVEIRLIDLDEKIRPGMSCDADIKTDTRRDVLSVPIQSVTARIPKKEDVIEEENGDSTNNAEARKEKLKPVEVVFLEEGNLAKMKEVKTGISDDTYMEITEGLEEDQMVVSGPYKAISKELEEGTKVKITNKRGKQNTEEEK